MDVTTATPAEIDAEIQRIQGEQAKIEADTEQAARGIEALDNITSNYSKEYWWTPAQRADKRAEFEALIRRNADAFAKLADEVAPLYARYNAERWNRYYLVTNTNGHIHTHKGCRTCFDTTQFAWLTEESGKTHEDVTGRAGEVSCAECFPGLPPEIMARKSQIEDPAKRKTRLEREAAKAERLAKKIANGLTDDGSEFVIEWFEGGYVKGRNEQGQETRTWVEGAARRREYFKTERAASIFWVDAHAWGTNNPSKREALVKIVEAMAAKHNKNFDDMLAELQKKVDAKKKRDGLA